MDEEELMKVLSHHMTPEKAKRVIEEDRASLEWARAHLKAILEKADERAEWARRSLAALEQ